MKNGKLDGHYKDVDGVSCFSSKTDDNFQCDIQREEPAEKRTERDVRNVKVTEEARAEVDADIQHIEVHQEKSDRGLDVKVNKRDIGNELIIDGSNS